MVSDALAILATDLEGPSWKHLKYDRLKRTKAYLLQRPLYFLLLVTTYLVTSESGNLLTATRPLSPYSNSY
jgi:hypothetical protein